jgi:hypothetical protein
LHHVPLYGQFVQLDSGLSRLHGESTIWPFRHLLEEHKLSLQIMFTINATQAQGANSNPSYKTADPAAATGPAPAQGADEIPSAAKDLPLARGQQLFKTISQKKSVFSVQKHGF